MKTILALLLLAAPALAETSRVDRTVERLATRLHFDDAGRTKLRGVLGRYDEKLHALRADAHVTSQQIRQLLSMGDADPKHLGKMTDRLANDRQQIHTLSAQRMAELKKQLTAEQYASLVTYRRQKRG